MAAYLDRPGPQAANQIAATPETQLVRYGLDFAKLIAELPSSRRRTWRRQTETRLAELELRIAAFELLQARSA